MSIINSSTKFVGINPNFPTAERKSAQNNAAQEVVTMQDIADTVLNVSPTPPDPAPLAFANAATVGALSYSPTYNNGTSGVGATLTATLPGVLRDTSAVGKIDTSYTPVAGDVILVKNQSGGISNGLYVITTVGSVSTPYVLTRFIDFDQSAELYPLQVNVISGNSNTLKYFIQTTANPTIGTSNLIFSLSTLQQVASQIAFIDTVIDTPLSNIVYADGTAFPTIPGSGATLTSTVNGALGTYYGLTANVNSTIALGFTRVLLTNQTNPAYNGDYQVINAGSASTRWQLRRIQNVAGGFDRYTRYFVVSNASSTKAGKVYFTKPNSPALTNATIGTAAINIFEYPQIDAVPTDASVNAVSSNGVFDALANKQDTLVSATNIKTINGTTLLGSGNIAISTGLTIGTTPITSGTVGRILFQGTGDVIQEDANLAYDSTLKRLTLKAVGTAATDIPFAIQNSAGTANLMQVAGDNTMTFLSTAGNIGFSSSDLGGNIKIKRNFSSQTMIELGGGDNAFIKLNPNNVSSYIGFGSFTDNHSMFWDGTNFHFQSKNTFHNVFDVVTSTVSATATFRIGTIASNTNFFNVHGRNTGGTGLTTNPIFTINSSGTVGIGTEASTPQARLDVRAQGVLSTDIAFRVRNSADTANIVSINGIGDILLGANAVATLGTGGNGTVIAIGENSAVNSGFNKSPIAIGKNSVSNGNAIAIGNGASNGTGQTISANIAIGENAVNLNATINCISIGSSVQTGQTANTIAIGGSINFSNYLGGGNIAVGYNFNGGNFISDAYAFGRASSATTLDLANSFSIFINRTTRSFFVNQNSNLVFRTNNTLTSGTHFDASATNAFTVHNGVAPTSNIADAFQQYSKDIIAGNAAPHFRTENGDVIKLYRETTAVVAASFVSNTSLIANDSATYGGYTMGQVVAALKAQGLLA